MKGPLGALTAGLVLVAANSMAFCSRVLTAGGGYRDSTPSIPHAKPGVRTRRKKVNDGRWHMRDHMGRRN